MNNDTNNPCLLKVIAPKKKNLGEFSVRRSLPSVGQKMVGPWIFFDHMGPAEFAPGDGINVRPHPHINLATVTYLFDGEILHRDSVGSHQTILPGDINLMVAGKGVTHSERSSESTLRTGQRLHALQLWLALPEEYEEIEPAFYHYPAVNIPSTTIKGVNIRLMMGNAYGMSSPVKTFAKTLYIEADLKVGQVLVPPYEQELAIYVAEGMIEIEGQSIPEFNMAILNTTQLDGKQQITITATHESRIAIIGGESIGPRYIDWNFVSSKKERITQAKHDWKHGNFEKVTGDEEEFIPLPE